MASLRLTFPEKDQPTVIALAGARLTIGRLPFNTIQIIDRTVSGFHAELISEHGHYRLHDRGSSNGTFVNGQRVADFHLNEPCTITFGTVEAQFSPEAVEPGQEAENFPTRSEINAVRKENAELKATVEALREEGAALRLARPMDQGEAALAVTKEEFDKVVVEREALKEVRLKLEEEIDRVKTDLAVLKRDRVNLQLAYDGVQREISEARAKSGEGEEVAVQPKTAAAVLAAQAPKIADEIRVEVPGAKPVEEAPAAPPSEKSVPATAQSVPPTTHKPFAPLPKAPVNLPAADPAPADEKPAPAKAPSAPLLPRAPREMGAAPGLPKPASFPGIGAKPGVSLPKAPAIGSSASAQPRPVAPSAPMKAPAGLGSGLRPIARPVATAPASAENGNSNAQPVAAANRVGVRPQPSLKLPTQPTVKLSPAPAPSGPKGTQKLS